jgi:ABC-type lipoprotein export system ATPase subunit
VTSQDLTTENPTAETLTAPTVEYGADALIVCDNLVRIYQVENIEVQALQGLDLLVDKGEMIAIVGQSGSGKSTLLNVLSGLDVPTAGAARVAGWDLLRMTHSDRLTYRRSVVGFVWQQTGRNLLAYLSAKENVMLPMAFAGVGGKKRAEHAMELLAAMGMQDKAARRPGQLSGGEQQRVAIAVALANNPEVIFADEPTGELDSATGDDVFEALRAANRDLGATVVVVTHDHAVSSQVQRTVAIRDGRTATEVVRRTHVDSEGVTQTIHEEYAVLDRAGRMQLPRDYRTSLGLKDRVRLELENDHIGVWPDGSVKKVRHEPPAPVAQAPAEPIAGPPQDAPERHVVESPSKPPAVTGAIPVVSAPEPEPTHEAEAEAEALPEPEAGAEPTYRPSPYADLSAYAPPLQGEDEVPYVPRVAAPPSPPEAEPEAHDPYAPPTQEDEAPATPTPPPGPPSGPPPRAPWLPKENSDD